MNCIAKLSTILFSFFFLWSCVFPGNAVGITIEEEEELSKEFLKIALKHYDIIEDPAIADYVNRVGQKIVAELPAPPFNYHFYVIRQDV